MVSLASSSLSLVKLLVTVTSLHTREYMWYAHVSGVLLLLLVTHILCLFFECGVRGGFGKMAALLVLRNNMRLVSPRKRIWVIGMKKHVKTHGKHEAIRQHNWGEHTHTHTQLE